MANYSMFCSSLWGLKKDSCFFFMQTESSGIIIPFWKTKHSKFPLMIIVVLGMACVSLGSLCGIWDFIRGLNFRSEVCFLSLKHFLQEFEVLKAVLMDAQCLSINTQSHSLLPPLGVRTAETTVRKRRRNSGALGCLQVPIPSPHLLFSYHIQPRTILFSISTWACEAHESLPWSCNLSCNRLMRIVLQEQLCVWVIPQVIAQIRPHSVQTVPYYSHRVPVLVVKAERKRPHRRTVC